MIRTSDIALLVLEDGTVYRGAAFAPGHRCGEVVFNTSMTGYQEILTDPSYMGQIVVMTQPHMGNYGLRDDVAESHRPWVEGFVVRRLTATPSSHLAEEDLAGYLQRHGIPGIEGLDTRALVRRLRVRGAMRGIVSTTVTDTDRLLEEVRASPEMAGRQLAEIASTEAPYDVAPTGAPRCRLALFDFGAKENIVRSLVARGAHVTVLPAGTSATDVEALGVDGVVLSNGPGDPEPLTDVVTEVRSVLDRGVPTLGICLGHQLLGLALGGSTYKLKFGHHGGNQPVKDLVSGKTLITSQNHGFAVDGDSLPDDCRVTQVNLNDGTIEGFEVEDRPIVSVQYHPEAAPGPREAATVFDRFLSIVEEARA